MFLQINSDHYDSETRRNLQVNSSATAKGQSKEDEARGEACVLDKHT